MTLDEAIKHAEEVAEEKDMQAGFDTDYLCYQMSDAERNQCKKCAEEHRQLAKWLKDYKRLAEWELELSYNSIKTELKQKPCKGIVYLTKEAYEELCYKASKWNDLESEE